MIYFDPEKELVLTCNAIQHGVGAIFLYVLLYGSEKPDAFASRMPLLAKNYSQLDKESLK